MHRAPSIGGAFSCAIGIPSAVRKNLILTGWLALPILVFGGLVAWIFITASRPKAMNVDPVGPGAGDTGGANALGEWIAGRNPNDVERANIARREGRPIDPFRWPSGIEVIVLGDPEQPMSFGWIDAKTGLLRSQILRQRDGAWRAVLIEHRPEPGALVYVGMGEMTQRIRGAERTVIDARGMVIGPQSVQPVVPEGTQASDPLPMIISIGG